MKERRVHTSAVFLLVVLAVAACTSGCLFGGGSSGGGNTTVSNPGSTVELTATTLPGVTGTTENAAFSTFRSKDPFIQQAMPTTTTVAGGTPGGGSTGSTIPTGSTIFRPTSSTSGGSKGTTTTVHGGSTSSTGSTTTTAPYLHTIKVLSVSMVDGSPAATLLVDGTVYKNKHARDVMWTNDGQIRVLEVDVASGTVSALLGSEPHTWSVGVTYH